MSQFIGKEKRNNIPPGILFFRRWGLFRIWLSFITFSLPLFYNVPMVNAEEVSRVIEKETELLASHWQLAQWQDGKTICNIFTRNDQQPSYDEIYEECGNETYLSWLKTPPCYSSSGEDCIGLLVRYVGKEQHLFKETVQLPKISFVVESVNCIPGEWCSSHPELNIIGKEPVEGYKITNVNIRIDEYSQVCQDSKCLLQLPITDEQGYWLEYWANSDFGDESDHFFVKFRNYKEDLKTDLYRVDIISEQFADQLPSGSLLWNLFPPVDQLLPEPLDQPLSAGYLSTTNRYLFLAGNLIKNGYVNAKSCQWGGLTETGAANPCGEKAAADMVLEWQNKFDKPIYEAAKKYNVPARVVKGIIAQESQFWHISSSPYELGLGMITENGVDMLLLWNPEYYLGVCDQFYPEDRCSKGYSELLPGEMIMLRRNLIDKIGTDEEIDLLAAILMASATQTNQLVKNITTKSVSDVVSYEEMWKMSIGNYYSGSGCLGAAMETVVEDHGLESEPITWEEVTNQFKGDCKLAKGYVDKVFELSQ